MSAPVRIQGGENSVSAIVTDLGQLVVAPIAYSRPTYVFMDLINTTYNVLKPVANKDIIVTGLVLNANRNVSNTTGGTVQIYTASTEGAAAGTNFFILELVRNQTITLTNLNIQIDRGLFVNARTDDDDFNLTLFSYRI